MACDICKKKNGAPYTCPRCNKKYCSSLCYKSREHEICSESFFREWVESSLCNKTFDDEEKSKMVCILKKHDKFVADDEDNICDKSSISDRFAGLNIDDVNEDVLWQNLSKEEKAEFKALIENKNLESLITLKQPWWTVTILNLVTDMDDEKQNEKDDVSPRPNFPLNVKKLCSMTSKKPSKLLQFNIVNILYSYTFLYRFYNCDLRDFLDDVVNLFFVLCPVLEGKNYCSLEESVQDSIRLIINSELDVSLDFAKSVVNDISSIIQGPNNAKSSMFVLCALNDIKLLLLEMKSLESSKRKHVDKCSRKRLMPAVKKIEYYLSWSLDFENNFKELASDLLLLMLPELFTEVESPRQDIIQDIVKSKCLIEEIDG